MLVVCEVLFTEEFSHCRGFLSVACQVFLVRKACLSVLVGGAGFFSLYSETECAVMCYKMLMVWSYFVQPVY